MHPEDAGCTSVIFKHMLAVHRGRIRQATCSVCGFGIRWPLSTVLTNKVFDIVIADLVKNERRRDADVINKLLEPHNASLTAAPIVRVYRCLLSDRLGRHDF
jgi:hypothetical protein